MIIIIVCSLVLKHDHIGCWFDYMIQRPLVKAVLLNHNIWWMSGYTRRSMIRNQTIMCLYHNVNWFILRMEGVLFFARIKTNYFRKFDSLTYYSFGLGLDFSSPWKTVLVICDYNKFCSENIVSVLSYRD
jgi:protein associated with RNAse G/E